MEQIHPLPFIPSFHAASFYTKDPLLVEMVCVAGVVREVVGFWGEGLGQKRELH